MKAREQQAERKPSSDTPCTAEFWLALRTPSKQPEQQPRSQIQLGAHHADGVGSAREAEVEDRPPSPINTNSPLTPTTG